MSLKGCASLAFFCCGPPLCPGRPSLISPQGKPHLAVFPLPLVRVLEQPNDLWFPSKQRKSVMVFAVPGERGFAELCGDFQLCFLDRNGDFHWYGHRPWRPPQCHSQVLEHSTRSRQGVPAPRPQKGCRLTLVWSSC